ncbi:hypothetical protein PF005_g14087 [Phytophthora fragariae]|uniref:Uncharacterized protein n=1 Tax=Phytophthora fragariae TaxID=53985 RepID=A0A6A3RTP6_9STRA|nr:hypothetical protein PF007_g14389 [Phytophthora fragariae]KAE9203678.1 hypothetical protein PF005_g14087 [Phytophthora fragariae]
MTKISGPCSYDKCEILHGEELVVEPSEFKSDGQSYRRKSGVNELHTEHKRLLQDISDRMRDVEEEKKKKKDKKKEKATALQTQGEILRDQAVTRRSERGDAATEASEDSTDTGERTSGANKPHTETQGC